MSLTLSPTHRENGNIFFIILVAVALFAALSFAISQGMRGSSASVSKEQAELYASELFNYAKTLESAVQRMLSRGVSENDLCFDIDDYPGGNSDYEHASCANTRNRVFHPDGGGITYQAPNIEVLDASLSGNASYGEWGVLYGTRVNGVGTNNATGVGNELVLALGYLNQGVCLAINRKLDIPLFSNDAPVDDVAAIYYNRYATGDLNSGNNVLNGDWPIGQSSGCFKSDSAPTPSGSYHFVHTLIAR